MTDNQVNMAACAWKDGDGLALTSPFTLQVASAVNNKDFATCILGPFTAAAGTHINTASADSIYSGTHYTDTDTATYATTGLTLAKSVTQSYFTAAGATLNYSYLVTNSGAATLNGPVTVTDDKATVTCPALSSIGNLNNYLEAGESLTCTASYTVTAADVTAKSVTNTATAATPAGGNIAGATSNASSKTVPLAPDLVALKTNSVGGTVLLGGTFKWVISVANSTTAGTASFTNGQTLLTDDLSTSGATYSLGTVTATGVTGTISCAIATNTVNCTANGAVTIPPAMTGSVAVTNGNPVVTGTGTTFSTEVTAGSVIVISNVPYSVLSIQSNTQLTLTANYAGTTASGLAIPASFSVPVTVTPSAAGSLVNPKGGGTCKANPGSVIPEIDTTNNSCANTVNVLNLPSLTVVKSVQTVSDPVNGTSSPKSIPGAVMQYTVQVINSGLGTVDNNKTVITDAIPANTAICVTNSCSNPPVALTSCSATPPCGLTLTYGTDVTFSSQAGGGAPYSYPPSPDANGFDANVTGVRINPQGILNAASGGNNASFSVTFKVQIK